MYKYFLFIILSFLIGCASANKVEDIKDAANETSKQAESTAKDVKDVKEALADRANAEIDKAKDSVKAEVDSLASKKYLNEVYAGEKSIKKLKDPKEIEKIRAIFAEANKLYKLKKNQESVSKYEEGLELGTDPEAYYRYGNGLSNLNRYEDAMSAYNLSLKLGYEKDYYVIYNKACMYSRLKNSDLAFEHILTSVEKGYKGISYMSEDPDLEYLRSLPEWKAKYKEIKKKAREKEETPK